MRPGFYDEKERRTDKMAADKAMDGEEKDGMKGGVGA